MEISELKPGTLFYNSTNTLCLVYSENSSTFSIFNVAGNFYKVHKEGAYIFNKYSPANVTYEDFFNRASKHPFHKAEYREWFENLKKRYIDKSNKNLLLII